MIWSLIFRYCHKPNHVKRNRNYFDKNSLTFKLASALLRFSERKHDAHSHSFSGFPIIYRTENWENVSWKLLSIDQIFRLYKITSKIIFHRSSYREKCQSSYNTTQFKLNFSTDISKKCAWYWCRPPGLGPEHINEKNCSFKVPLFSRFVVDLILRSFLFTHIEIAILTTKKCFLHRALLFLLWVVKLYFCCSEWANELHNVNSARSSGPGEHYHRSGLCFDHFTVKNQIDTKTKSTAIRRPTICRESVIRNVRYWKRTWFT